MHGRAPKEAQTYKIIIKLDCEQRIKALYTHGLSNSSPPSPTLPNCMPSFSTEALKAEGITTAWSDVLKRLAERGTPIPRKPLTGVAGFAEGTIGDAAFCVVWFCKLSCAGNTDGGVGTGA